MTSRADMMVALLAAPIGMRFEVPATRDSEPSVTGKAPGAIMQLLGPPEQLSTFKLSIEFDGPLGGIGARTTLLTVLIQNCWPDDSTLLLWSLQQMRDLFVPRTTMMDAIDDTHRVRLSCDRAAQRFNVIFRLSDD